MKYLQPKFSIIGASQAYRDNYDRIFRKEDPVALPDDREFQVYANFDRDAAYIGSGKVDCSHSAAAGERIGKFTQQCDICGLFLQERGEGR